MMELKPIEDVFTIVRGISFPKTARSEEAEQYVNCLRTANIQKDIVWTDLWSVPMKYISRSEQLIQKNDIIVSIANSLNLLGKSAMVTVSPDNCTFGTFIVALRPKEAYNPRYLYYTLKSEFYYQQVRSLASTTTNISNLSTGKLKTILLPIPPLSEQERIVAKIEELFSQLDAGVETLKKTKAQLAVYRQAVLKEAFSACGDTVAMGDVATMIDPQPSHRTPPEYEGGIPYIGIGDIDYKERTIKLKEARKVSSTVYEEHLQRYLLHDGDFVMGKIGTIGKPFRLPLPQNYTLSANVILIQPDAEKINPEYLFWQFSSPTVTEQLMEGKNETSQPAFGIQKARLLRIKMCEPSDQERVVNDIREKMSVCDSIEQTVDTALQQAEAMRQSILKKAFEGAL